MRRAKTQIHMVPDENSSRKVVGCNKDDRPTAGQIEREKGPKRMSTASLEYTTFAAQVAPNGRSSEQG